MSTVTASSRPYVSRRKRHHSSPLAALTLSPKVTLGLFGLLLLALVASLGIIIYNLGRSDDAAATASYESGVAATAAPDSGPAPAKAE